MENHKKVRILESENLSLKTKVAELEKTILSLENEIEDLNDELESYIYSESDADQYLCLFHEYAEKYEYSQKREEKLKSDLEDANRAYEKMKEFHDMLLNWRDFIPEKDNEKARDIFKIICHLNLAFVENLLDMARLYRENPIEELDKVLDPTLLSAIKGKGAAMLNRFRTD